MLFIILHGKFQIGNCARATVSFTQMKQVKVAFYRSCARHIEGIANFQLGFHYYTAI